MIPSIPFLLATLIVGLIMGLLGGGGSTISVPLLTLVGKLDTGSAITTSLFIVSLGAVGSTIVYHRKRLVDWRMGLTLAPSAMVASYFGGRAAKYISPSLLMILFASLMIASSVSMFVQQIRGKNKPDEEQEEQDVAQATEQKPLWVIILIGLGIGIVTGLVGAGGGFIVVPVLVILARLDMKRAVATSLLVIALNACTGLLGHLSHITLDWTFTLITSGIMLVGSVAGTFVSDRIDSSKLKLMFAILIFVLAVVMIGQELDNLFP